MFFISLERNEDGDLTVGLRMEKLDYNVGELVQALKESINQIGPMIMHRTIYLDDTIATRYSMEIGWILKRSYGCTVYVWNNDASEYVQLKNYEED